MTEVIDRQLEMNEEQYGNFIRCLNNLKEICNDIDIREGTIRQRSNDRSCIFEFDMQSILEDISMPISDVKKKLELLKAFMGQRQVFINIHLEPEESESYFTVSDEYSSIKFIFPAMQFMDNEYLTEEEVANILSYDEENLLLHTQLENLITDRIRIFTENFNANAIQVFFDDEMASIKTQTQSKDQYATFKDNISTNIALEPSSVNLVTIAFKMEHDTSVDLDMYKDSERPITVNKLETRIGDIEVKVSSKSSIIPLEEE
jgi:hypothetical protein